MLAFSAIPFFAAFALSPFASTAPAAGNLTTSLTQANFNSMTGIVETLTGKIKPIVTQIQNMSPQDQTPANVQPRLDAINAAFRDAKAQLANVNTQASSSSGSGTALGPSQIRAGLQTLGKALVDLITTVFTLLDSLFGGSTGLQDALKALSVVLAELLDSVFLLLDGLLNGILGLLEPNPSVTSSFATAHANGLTDYLNVMGQN
ncbi:hypothetical protein BD410DRAFT_185725 [Rickenella mellea]|uniref:Uncharacterized protein n=1 Tax=Rickenella mellea TaxID=50990 RepID=A0A4Y7Q6P9_9AGAM|nr:hypothetical protein BD410DRAFT_185725 [Rickenella mellea]